MADKKQLEILKQGIKDWNKWKKDHPSVAIDLTEANLTGANLTGVNLAGANLAGSYVGCTTFRNNDLSSSRGLERSEHGAPSSISTDTIRKSKGKIPIEFLRGCGLSDLEIESAKLAAPELDPDQVSQITYEMHRLYCDQPIQFYSCFISYNSKDHDFAQRLHDDLQNNGVREFCTRNWFTWRMKNSWRFCIKV